MSVLDFDEEQAQKWVVDTVEEMERLRKEGGDEFEQFTFKEVRAMFAGKFLRRVKLQTEGVPIVLKTNARGPIHDHYMHPDEKKWLKLAIGQAFKDRAPPKKDKKLTTSVPPKEDKGPSTSKSAATKAKPKAKAKGGFAAQFDKTLFSVITSMGIRKREASEWPRKKLMREMLDRLTDMEGRGWRPKPREKKEGEGESKSEE